MRRGTAVWKGLYGAAREVEGLAMKHRGQNLGYGYVLCAAVSQVSPNLSSLRLIPDTASPMPLPGGYDCYGLSMSATV